MQYRAVRVGVNSVVVEWLYLSSCSVLRVVSFRFDYRLVSLSERNENGSTADVDTMVNSDLDQLWYGWSVGAIRFEVWSAEGIELRWGHGWMWGCVRTVVCIRRNGKTRGVASISIRTLKFSACCSIRWRALCRWFHHRSRVDSRWDRH